MFVHRLGLGKNVLETESCWGVFVAVFEVTHKFKAWFMPIKRKMLEVRHPLLGYLRGAL